MPGRTPEEAALVTEAELDLLRQAFKTGPAGMTKAQIAEVERVLTDAVPGVNYPELRVASCVTISAQSNHADAHDAVHFATMHRAKGLEFDAVVVVAPLFYFGSVEESVNQRRLVYVALTRAKRAAILLQLG
jgi:superfamily I DNA/RNA helicase